MARFSKKARSILIDAGWTNNRNVKIDAPLNDISHLGYRSCRALELFLKEFFGLSCSFSSGPELFNFHILDIDSIQSQNLKRYLGEEVYPIGSMRGGYLHIYLTSGGKMYAESDNEIYLIGENIDMAVEFICSRGNKSWTLDPL